MATKMTLETRPVVVHRGEELDIPLGEGVYPSRGYFLSDMAGEHLFTEDGMWRPVASLHEGLDDLVVLETLMIASARCRLMRRDGCHLKPAFLEHRQGKVVLAFPLDD